jgi:hypothetical protein
LFGEYKMARLGNRNLSPGEGDRQGRIGLSHIGVVDRRASLSFEGAGNAATESGLTRRFIRRTM